MCALEYCRVVELGSTEASLDAKSEYSTDRKKREARCEEITSKVQDIINDFHRVQLVSVAGTKDHKREMDPDQTRLMAARNPIFSVGEEVYVPEDTDSEGQPVHRRCFIHCRKYSKNTREIYYGLKLSHSDWTGRRWVAESNIKRI